LLPIFNVVALRCIAPPAPQPLGFGPYSEETDVNPGTDLLISFSKDIFKGSGDIEIHKTGNTLMQTIDVNSDNVTINGKNVTRKIG